MISTRNLPRPSSTLFLPKASLTPHSKHVTDWTDDKAPFTPPDHGAPTLMDMAEDIKKLIALRHGGLIKNANLTHNDHIDQQKDDGKTPSTLAAGKAHTHHTNASIFYNCNVGKPIPFHYGDIW